MDKSRMQVFKDCNFVTQTVFVSSLSKMLTLTGDRFGWVSFGNRQLAELASLGWNNFSAGLPREWQLSFMAHLELVDTRPELVARVRELYALRRTRLIAQLRQVNDVYHVFEEIGRDEGGGIYNWSKFRAGEDVFTLFEKTGIAGVPGSAFGYSDRFVRFSVGIVPSV
jgi:aspartate/methionine/tyrosine aminotransferase